MRRSRLVEGAQRETMCRENTARARTFRCMLENCQRNNKRQSTHTPPTAAPAPKLGTVGPFGRPSFLSPRPPAQTASEKRRDLSETRRRHRRYRRSLSSRREPPVNQALPPPEEEEENIPPSFLGRWRSPPFRGRADRRRLPVPQPGGGGVGRCRRRGSRRIGRAPARAGRWCHAPRAPRGGRCYARAARSRAPPSRPGEGVQEHKRTAVDEKRDCSCEEGNMTQRQPP